jgi:streptomycin 6-kinase
MRLTIPPDLAAAADDDSRRRDWLACLPRTVDAIAGEWELELGEPYLPGGVCAWVAPVSGPAGEALVLKVGWRHFEAEHEADALRLWDGDGAVRCLASHDHGQTAVLLLERCDPGVQLKRSAPEHEQDRVLAGLARRLWERTPVDGRPFRPLRELCDQWAESWERRRELDAGGLDRGLTNAGIELLRELPTTAERNVLLCTDLHAENILSARREPWLVIDPKPFLGDPAFDAVQHMLNCDERLATAPEALAERMAALLDVDPLRVRLWLFARCAQESIDDPSMRQPARRLAP